MDYSVLNFKNMLLKFLDEETMDEITKTKKLFEAYKERQKGNFSKALAIYKTLLEQNRNIEIIKTIAFCYYAQAMSNHNQWEKIYDALTWLDQAIELAPNDAHLYHVRAEIHSHHTLEVHQATKDIRKTLEINPNYFQALLLAASLYNNPEKTVSPREALAWLERAVMLDPNDPDVHLRIGQLHFEAGDFSKANSEFQTALTKVRKAGSSNGAFAQKIEALEKNKDYL